MRIHLMMSPSPPTSLTEETQLMRILLKLRQVIVQEATPMDVLQGWKSIASRQTFPIISYVSF